jgi:hypothetical protein
MNNNELTVVAYADDIVLMAESEDELRNTTSNLLNSTKRDWSEDKWVKNKVYDIIETKSQY